MKEGDAESRKLTIRDSATGIQQEVGSFKLRRWNWNVRKI